MVAATLIGVAAFFGVRAWRARVIEQQEQRAFVAARRLLKDNRPADALAVIIAHRQMRSAREWNPLEMEALVGAIQLPRLALIFERQPQRLLDNEDASLLLARAFCSGRKMEEFQRIRQAWAGRETHAISWFTLDADALLLAGQPREAEKLLHSRQFPGVEDATRLARLALLVAPRDLKAAYAFLDEASLRDPRNPDVRSFRGQILETIGKPALARVEYVAAHVAEPSSPLLRDQLAEFYRRQGNIDLALRTWSGALAPPSLDFIWIKTLFWRRVVQPMPTDAALKLPPGLLQAAANWLLALRAGHFWNQESFERLPQSRQLEQDRQELFWLKLLDALQAGRETDAEEMLKFNRFKSHSWAPDLEKALQRILHYRQVRSLHSIDLVAEPKPETHRFFTQLEEIAKQRGMAATKEPLPDGLDALVRGPHAFAAALMAAGWREAALTLANPTTLVADAPAWLSYGLTQCLRLNRSPRAALDFLADRKSEPTLELLAGELLLADGKPKTGLAKLASLAELDSDVGYRAAWLLALGRIERKQFDDARRVVERQPRLATTVIGRELLARTALLEGKTADADRLYKTIAANSVEAKTYLARQAFAQKRWADARRWTQELMRVMPDELQLRQNLLAIEKAEKAQ